MLSDSTGRIGRRFHGGDASVCRFLLRLGGGVRV